jgi:DNA-binding NarL/FixJ family response regulator
MSRILVVDDQAFMRSIVRSRIESQEGWLVCGEAANGKDAIEQAKLLKPDLIILDIHMPFMNGFEAARQILTLMPQMIILIVSIAGPIPFSKAAAHCGAKGYLIKSQVAENLVLAVTALLRSETYFSHG